MSKLGSLSFQVTEALNAIFEQGESRHAAKRLGRAYNHIYSIGTMQTYVEDCIRFAEWVRDEYDIHDLSELTQEHAQEYLDLLGQKGRAGGYLSRIKSAIEKLSMALHGERWNLGKGWHSDAHPERAYSRDDAAAIINDMRAHARDPQVADVAQLQLVAGLRIREAVHLRAQDIDVKQCRLYLECGTKGGRDRNVIVESVHRNFLQKMYDQACHHSDRHVFQGRSSLASRTENAINEACKRLGIDDCGTYGFRKTYAQMQYASYLRAGMDEPTARRKLANALGHSRTEVTIHYVGRSSSKMSSKTE